MIRFGLDRLLEQTDRLAGRRYALLSHQASLSSSLEPAHLALVRRHQPPARLLAPEHGFHGVEQDMVAAEERTDLLTGLPIESLYGRHGGTLRPEREVFEGLDLLIVDLQDIGARYYTFAATAVWSIEVALDCGLEVWVLDRPNPLGGVRVEGNLPERGFESFVGAFRIPVRHGLSLGELVLLEAERRGWARAGLEVLSVEGWRRDQDWISLGLPWVAPSPNMPSPWAAFLYPGVCLVEATEVSEGRGTTRPFQLVGAPVLDARMLIRRLEERTPGCGDGLGMVPTFFRPQFQKHAGEICSGVELVVVDRHRFDALRFGVELIATLAELGGSAFEWRTAPYEFVTDVPAIDLLLGTSVFRLALQSESSYDDWTTSWRADEAEFLAEREAVLLYS